MRDGEIDAISNLDPVITRLQEDGIVRLVTDSRFPRVNYHAVRRAPTPAAVLYAKQEFHRREPKHDPGAGECFLQDVEVDRDGDD